jgi:hypothetical protein
VELALNVLLIVVMAAVVLVLATGLVSFVAGGEFNRKYANKLMRLRVATQACAVLILLLLLLLRGTGRS